jgi:TIR domain
MDEPGKTGESGRPEALGQPGAGSKRPVFISYASADARIAQRLCSALEGAGIRCWIAPRDVVPGTLYADGIVHALDDSTILVLVLSKESITSGHVGRELERAASKRHPIIALKVDTAPLTAAFEYYLNESQWVELGRDGEHPAIARLVEAVAQHLAPGSAAEIKAPQTQTPSTFKSRKAWGVAAAVVVLALATGYLLVGKAWLPKHASVSVVANKSIAVLPFVDMSEKKDQEYWRLPLPAADLARGCARDGVPNSDGGGSGARARC